MEPITTPVKESVLNIKNDSLEEAIQRQIADFEIYEHFFNKFARKIGINISENTGARYIINIHTLVIYPGYNVGVWNESSAIKAEISIYDKKNPNVLLLKALYGKSIGNTTYNAGDRIANCYNTLAASFYRDIKKRALK